jgi:hypothetical protein
MVVKVALMPQGRCMMKCQCCESPMIEEEIIVSGGPIKTKGLVAWHCFACGRIEYRRTVTHYLIFEEFGPAQQAA